MVQLLEKGKKDIYTYIGVFLSILIAFIFIDILGFEDNAKRIEIVMIYSILII